MNTLRKVRNYIINRLLNSAASGSGKMFQALAIYLGYRNWSSRSSEYFLVDLNRQESIIFEQIKIGGYCVIENFWTLEQCEEARKEIDRLITDYPENLHPNAKSDQRIYGADRRSHLIKSFSTNVTLKKVASLYNQEDTKTAFTLGARMYSKPESLGSGEGWHRDAPYRQFKAILYLTNVDINSGPFQLIEFSNRIGYMVIDSIKAGLNYLQFRIANDQAEKIIASKPSRLTSLTGKAGTLILVDTAHIHRGMPIKNGCRYALTNYYYPIKHIDGDLLTRFNVLDLH